MSRFLAAREPHASFVGCDRSEQRLVSARAAAAGLPNLRFVEQDLLALHFDGASFDVIVCRYVLQHLHASLRPRVVAQLLRCLKPGGTLRIVEMEGVLQNVYPRPPIAEEVLAGVRASGAVDMEVGRKLPHLLMQAGFTDIRCRVQAVEFGPEDPLREAEGTFIFYNKFLVTAVRP